jgi:hypothetical protein
MMHIDRLPSSAMQGSLPESCDPSSRRWFSQDFLMPCHYSPGKRATLNLVAYLADNTVSAHNNLGWCRFKRSYTESSRSLPREWHIVPQADQSA